ncbi:transposase [Pseudonocardia sp. EC080625-04]|uniref:IS110 family transposase n=1 Tax=Pseudonocardia sp. EC080625-04 TaxID=1096868 RepID=UPI0006CB4CCE|nr:IS110 family transposase [Pseudonocardia sp. EC080625-04]ALE71951.1 transposase [Pseudonocardia sp. EC080625-04]
MPDPDPSPSGFAVFCGLDVGKSEHHACALDQRGKRLHDNTLPNNEAALRNVFTGLAEHGPVLVVVDQPASIGALAIAVARDLKIAVAYLPGLAMRRIADLHPGQAKTDARDAHVIAEAARTMPHTLRRVGTDDETLAELSVLAGYDDDLAGQSTRLTNRLRDALLHVHPALERLLGPRLERGGVLDLLAAAPTPAALRELGADGIAQVMQPRSPRLARTLPTQILAALDAQTLVVPGTAAFARVITGVATQLREVHAERDDLAADLEARLEAHPLGPVLTSMPGVGVRTAIKILTIVGDGSAFPTAGHLAAYAGLAPVTRRSGSSIKGETRSQRGNHALKSALFLSAFAALADPASRTYYDRKRAQGKRHNAALICLARRRTDVLFAMLRDRRHYTRPVVREPDPGLAAA